MAKGRELSSNVGTVILEEGARLNRLWEVHFCPTSGQLGINNPVHHGKFRAGDRGSKPGYKLGARGKRDDSIGFGHFPDTQFGSPETGAKTGFEIG
jgi:hypothetical protein